MSERRANERHQVWFPMTVVTATGEQGTAITYDLSATGVLIACPGRLEVGERVTLRFSLRAGEEERAFAGKIARVEESADDLGPWRFRMAVELDEACPELDGLLEI